MANETSTCISRGSCDILVERRGLRELEMDGRKTLGWRGQPSVHVTVPQSTLRRPMETEDVPAMECQVKHRAPWG